MENHSESEDQDCSPSEAMGLFFGAFGEIDVYAQIVLEEFMEALLEN